MARPGRSAARSSPRGPIPRTLAAMTAARAAREDAADRARRARDRLAALRRQQDELTAARDAAVVELSARGLSYDEIAPLAGISRARVGQVVASARLLNGGPPPAPAETRRTAAG